ncbi:hypothetical protein [Baaleninema sp.]|uniref:hypothetical protein n=1 Tax=Baaleninema sp. TaxID=3101197 RepID=UPI003D003D21
MVRRNPGKISDRAAAVSVILPKFRGVGCQSVVAIARVAMERSNSQEKGMRSLSPTRPPTPSYLPDSLSIQGFARFKGLPGFPLFRRFLPRNR